MKGKEIKGWLKAPLNDDLGGLPSRTVLSDEPLMPFAIDPHPPVAPQGLVLAGAPRRVDARESHGTIVLLVSIPRLFLATSCQIGWAPSVMVYNDRALAPPLPYERKAFNH